MNIQEKDLVSGLVTSFSIPLVSSRILVGGNFSVGAWVALYEQDLTNTVNRFFLSPNTAPLDLKNFVGNATSLYVMGAIGTPPDESFSVWVV